MMDCPKKVVITWRYMTPIITDIKERILNEAMELFKKFGLRTITMDEIATRLGISKKTIYQYYPTKDDIILEGAQKHLSCEHENIEGIVSQGLDPIEEFLNILASFTRDMQEINPCLPHEIRKYHPRAWELVKEKAIKYFFQVVENNLRRGIDMGLYREELDVNIVVKFHVLNTTHLFEIFPENEYSFTEVKFQYEMLFLYGICTMKGRELLEQHKHTILPN